MHWKFMRKEEKRVMDILPVICIYEKWCIGSHYHMITASKMGMV